ncbi:MAG: CcoQ/FixQ family Cbb3-type cytochrome c oxidase assembly chaperone [Alphaproteobacteria bacterium]|nr:CcoQ/FixQ family Cbb3-type cytochrome c oxidase assembly chaperone [Alphaproteobacteria bacterium]
MDYETVSTFAKSWGVVYFMLMFVAVCAYAFWPRNKEKFDRAANIPLNEDEQ